MQQYVEWCERISDKKVDSILQTEIADKILELLDRKKESVSAWDEVLFGQAIMGLSINVNARYQPTDAGLGNCLTALRQVLALRKEPNRTNGTGQDTGKLLGHGALVTTVEKLKKRI